MLDVLKGLIQDESAQGMVEYALVLGVLATGVMVFILALRYSVEDLYKNVTNAIIESIKNLI
ncbi:MAG: hypothetical protein LIR50_15525 [Bacillota bacterium]|nr:hypothetical protein [Bacillota bacterium]